MKNLKQKLILCVGVILAGLIAACSNPFTEPGAFNAGTGNVRISIAGGNGRTILPAATGFSRYALEVAGAGNNPAVPEDLSGITGSGVSMTLPAGEYTVTVKAYRTSGGNEYLAAQGNKTLTVTSGSAPVAVVIDLKPFIGEENGFFSYHITLPGETETAVLSLKAVDDSYNEEFNLMDSAVSSEPIELTAGYYDMFISLAKGTVSAGEYAAVHIYSGMETNAVLDLSNDFDTINLEPLIKLIEDVENELERLEEAGGNITISDDGENVLVGWLWVTQDAADALQTALAAAKDIVENPPEKQRYVNAALNDLEAALTAFDPQHGTNLDAGAWTGLIAEVGTPITLTVNSGAWTLSVPLVDTNVTGTYTVSNGVITLMREDAVFATGTPSAADNTLTLTLTTAILGADAVTLTQGTAPPPASDIEYLYSGIWSDTGTPPVITYISGDKWTFSLPYEGEQADGTFIVYDRKAAFYKTDGALFAVGKVATEQAELTGNTLTIYPVTGGSFALTLNPYPIPYVGNWQGGDTIGGTLYVSITTWTLEDASGVVAEGEYVWDGNEAYFISGGARFATGTINEDKNVLTVVVNNAVQEFTLIPSPFIGNWRKTLMFVVNIDAAVTANAYAITSIAGNASGQYAWRNVNGTNTAYFYSNGYSYGVATQTTNTKIDVALTEPISAPVIGTISSLDMTKR